MSDESDTALDDLLREATRSVQAPPALRRTVLGAVRRRRRLAAFTPVAAAAGLLLAAAWSLAPRGHEDPRAAAAKPTHEVVSELVPKETPIAAPAEPAVVFNPGREFIVVRQERVAPDVTVVQLIPTTRAGKIQRRRALAESIRNRIAQRGGPS